MDTLVTLTSFIVFQNDHYYLQIHIHGTATPIVGQHFRGNLFDINPETMEYSIPDKNNPDSGEGEKRTYNLELWDSLPGPLEDPPTIDFKFQERARSCVAKALDNLYYARSTNEKGEEVKSWLFKEDPNGELTV